MVETRFGLGFCSNLITFAAIPVDNISISKEKQFSRGRAYSLAGVGSCVKFFKMI